MANREQVELLRRSVEEWNLWRKTIFANAVIKSRSTAFTIDLKGADLSGADLSGAYLYAVYRSKTEHIPGTYLNEANLSRATLINTDFRGADLIKANLSDANLKGANLSGADLSGANLRGANLRDADLTLANLRDADLTGADLTGADLTRTGLKDADLIGTKRGTSPSKSNTPEPPSTSWLSLVEAVGNTLLVTTASIASIIQGLMSSNDAGKNIKRSTTSNHQRQHPHTTLLLKIQTLPISCSSWTMADTTSSRNGYPTLTS